MLTKKVFKSNFFLFFRSTYFSFIVNKNKKKRKENVCDSALEAGVLLYNNV